MLNRLIERHAFSTTRGVDLLLTKSSIKIRYIKVDDQENWKGDIETFETDSWKVAQEVFASMITHPARRALNELKRQKKKYGAAPMKGSEYRHGDIVRIKKYKENSANAYGRVDGNPTDDKVWVTNLNMPFSGTVCGFLKPDEIELHKRK